MFSSKSPTSILSLRVKKCRVPPFLSLIHFLFFVFSNIDNHITRLFLFLNFYPSIFLCLSLKFPAPIFLPNPHASDFVSIVLGLGFRSLSPSIRSTQSIRECAYLIPLPCLQPRTPWEVMLPLRVRRSQKQSTELTSTFAVPMVPNFPFRLAPSPPSDPSRRRLLGTAISPPTNSV